MNASQVGQNQPAPKARLQETPQRFRKPKRGDTYSGEDVSKKSKKIGALVQPRTSKDDRKNFERARRYNCPLNRDGHQFIKVEESRPDVIRHKLNACQSIEHQFLALRDEIILTKIDYERRKEFTSQLLGCISRHHGVFYEGILFGSTVSGLGFRDSDVDLRLRLLAPRDECDEFYEPQIIDEAMVHRILKNIANTTTLCSPAAGLYIPSTKVPIAKLNFLPLRIHYRNTFDIPYDVLKDGLKYDVSISSTNPLASLNSQLLRFFCHLSPKFHLLATALRYWSKVHKIVLPGLMSSYALVNMIIFFCQTLEEPLLPTVDKMREQYFAHKDCNNKLFGKPLKVKKASTKALTKLEWLCVICTHASQYEPSSNKQLISVLLFKFFEFYLNFPYTTHVITIGPGRAIENTKFRQSNLNDPRFNLNKFLNIQDPFDLKHNLTAKISPTHFKKTLEAFRDSYERLYKQLMNSFVPPPQGKKTKKTKSSEWGLNAVFDPNMTEKPDSSRVNKSQS